MPNSLRVLTAAASRFMTEDTTSVVVADVVLRSRFAAVVADVNAGVKRAAASKQAILPPR